jgi:hypothetical protein
LRIVYAGLTRFLVASPMALAAALNPNVAVTLTAEPYPKLQSSESPATPGLQ